MGMLKKGFNSSNNEDSENDLDDSSMDSSDLSGIDEEGSHSDIGDDEENVPQNGNIVENNQEEEEDELIQAIRRESTKQRDHPPVIHCDEDVVDISFHPHEDILGVADIVGDVTLYKYTNTENVALSTLELHTKACRDIEFSADGKLLFSTSKDKAIMISDVESGKLLRFYENSHDVAVYCLSVICENLFATGDDDGMVKLWDVRMNNDKSIFALRKNESYISDICSHEEQKYLLCSSGDGSLTTIDLHNRKFFMQSEEYQEELTCLGLFRSETKLLAGSSKGKLFFYNWNEFGLHSDEFPGIKCSINDLIPITENIVVVACEDGNIRAVHLFPHRHLGIVGQHELSVERLDICNNGNFIASSGHNNDIRFWNIQYFEDFENINRKHKYKKKDVKNNLPSSRRGNVADFFSDL